MAPRANWKGFSAVIKRTVYIDGRKTSVGLEDAFWSTLKQIAQAQGTTVSDADERHAGHVAETYFSAH